MAGALTPEQRDAVNRIYGSDSNAIDEAVRRSEDLARLWEDGQSPIAWPNQREFRELWWKRALPVLGIPDDRAGDRRRGWNRRAPRLEAALVKALVRPRRDAWQSSDAYSTNKRFPLSLGAESPLS